MNNVIEILQSRGFIESMTSHEISDVVKKPIKFYIGFDPTADSLHIGNMVGIMAASWFQKCGHMPYIIVGGATGMIGDPSGKSVERNLLDEATIQRNLEGIKRSLDSILHFREDRAHLLNNYDWFKNFTFIEFLREVGKHFRMGTMLAKESVKARLNSEEGLSYTEFSYQLLQGYDFLHLFDKHGVILELGGSDQWGNITAGTELVRKMRGQSVHGLTFPLLTRSDGKKFGKSEEGTIWMNSDKLHPYEFYQYFFRIPDADVIKLMKVLTFMELDEISQIEKEMKQSSYKPNSAQKKLAHEVTKLVHGQSGVEQAEKITLAAAPGAETELSAKTLQALSDEIGSHLFAENDVVGCKLLDLAVKTGAILSKSEGRRLVQNGGFYLNNEKIQDENFVVRNTHLVERQFLLLAIGKKKKVVIKIT